MRPTLLVFLFVAIIIGGCNRVTTSFVSIKDVPESSSFVVLPFNYYKEQIDFANMVESALIASGVQVVHRPGTKEVEVRKDVEMRTIDKKEVVVNEGKVSAQEDGYIDTRRAEAKKIERYIELGDVKADYIVFTSGSVDYIKGRIVYWESSVRIVKSGSQEVLSSFMVHYGRINHEIYNALKALGIPTTPHFLTVDVKSKEVDCTPEFGQVRGK